MKILEIRSWKFSSHSTPKGKKRAKVSCGNEAGSLPLVTREMVCASRRKE